MFSSIKCVFAKHDYEQGAPFELWDSPWEWPDVLAKQLAGGVGCRDRGRLNTVSNLAGKRKDRMLAELAEEMLAEEMKKD